MNILAIEHEQARVQLLQNLFGNDCYTAEFAPDINTGLQMAVEVDYDLIIIDSRLPKLDRVGLSQQLRAQGFQGPIVMLTKAAEHAKQVSRSARRSALAFKEIIQEPDIDLTAGVDWAVQVQSLLQQADLAYRPILLWGYLSIDSESGEVTYGSHVLSLTQTERAILETLLRSPQTVFDAYTLIAHSSTASKGLAEDRIQDHIKTLRQKLTVVGAPKNFIKIKSKKSYQLNPLYSSSLIPHPIQLIASPSCVELNAVNEELLITLEQLQSIQTELEQKHQELEVAYQTIAQERQQLLTTRDAFVMNGSEHALDRRQSLDYLSTIYHGAAQSVFVVEVTEANDFRYVSFNQAAQQSLGPSAFPIKGKTPEEVFGSTIGKRFRTHYNRCLQTDDSITYEDQFIFDNSLIWTLNTLSPLRNEEGNINLILGTIFDISDRKRLETALRNQNATLDAIFNVTNIGVVQADPKTRRLWRMNAAFCAITGYTEAELLNLTVDDINHPDDRLSDRKRYSNLLRGNEAYQSEKRYLRKDGSTVWVQVSGGCIRDDDGQIISLFAIVQDISDRKRLETERQQAETQIRNSAVIDAFRVMLMDALRSLQNPSEIQTVASRILGEHLHVERAYYAETTPDGQYMIVPSDYYTSGVVPSIAGQYPVQNFSEFILRENLANRTVVVNDTRSLKTKFEAEYAAYQSLSVRAFISYPLVKDGTLVAVLCVTESKPRNWTDTDVALVVETADRTWAVLERARTETAMRDQEQLLRLALAGGQAGSWSWNLRTGALSWSSETFELYGLDPAAGLPDYEGWYDTLLHPDDRDWVNQNISDVLKKRQSDIEFEFRILHPHHGVRWLLTYGHLTVSDQGEPLYFSGINLDITDRKQTESALRESEKRFRNMADHAPVMIWVTDPTGYCTYLSKGWYDFSGQTKDTGLGFGWLDAVHPDDRQLTKAIFLSASDRRVPFRSEYRLRRADGDYRWALDAASPWFGEDGQFKGYIGSVLDISDRKQSEFALREMSEALSNALEGISRLDENGCYTFVNEAYALAVGYSPDEMIGMNWQRTVHSDDLDMVAAAYQHMLDQGQVEIEVRGLRKDGSVFHKQLFMTTVYTDRHHFAGHYCFMKDISAQKRLEAERKQAEAELKQSEQKLRAIFDSTFEFMGLLTTDGRLIDANRAALDAVSIDLAEVVNQPFWETPWWVDFPEQQEQLKQAIIRAAAGEFIRFEARHRLSTGVTAYVDFSLKPFFDEHGRVIMLIPEGRDISDRKRAELEMRKFEYLANNSGDFIGICDMNFNPIYGNPASLQMVGLDGSVPLDQIPVQEFFFPEDQDFIINEFFPRVFKEGQAEVEIRFRHFQTGEALWMIYNVSYLKNEYGEPIGLATLSRNITDRKRVELEIRKFEYLADNSADFIGICDMNFIPIYVNPAGLNMVGLDSRLQFDHTPVREFFFPEDQDFIIHDFFPRVLAAGQAEVEVRFRHFKTGETLWMIYNVSYLKDETGVPIGLATISRNITDRKAAELKLQQQFLREQLVADVSQDIRQSLDLNNVLSRTVERVREVLDTDRVIIFRFRPDWQGDVIMESVGEGWVPILGTSLYDPCFSDRYIEAYRQGRVGTITDIDTEHLNPCYAQLLKPFQVKASLVVPIMQDESVWGLLVAHQCSGPRQWQPPEIDLLRQLATNVGIAIQQSELYEQTRRELSAREQMQTVLEESEERFRALSAAAPIGICQTTASGICTYTNERWQQMSGLSFVDSLGNGWLRAIHPDDRDTVLRAWQNYIHGHDRENLPEFRLLTSQGVVRWVSARAAAMTSATGEVVGYVSIGEDITERKLAEAALRESEQRLQMILENSPASIYLIDAEGTYLLVNRICAEIVSKTPDQMVGRNLYDFWPADIATVLAADNRQVFETGKLLQTEEFAPLPDGIHTYITVKFPLFDTSGTPYAICGISTDITEKKQLENQFYRAQRLESLGTLASGIAHDLNNVLTPILAISQLLRSHYPNINGRARQMLQLVEDSAKRGANLIKQILTFTRGTGGDRHPVEVVPLLQEVIDVVQQTFPKTIRIQESIPEPFAWSVSADPTYLHQVFMNLCVNARDAMPHGGVLSFAVDTCFIDSAEAQSNPDAHVGTYAVVAITDTGTGISPDVRDRIFDPFFTTKAQGQGTGLGLATVLGIVKNYGGFVQVTSEVDEGTEVKVFLPIIEAMPCDLGHSELPLNGNGELVLLVDDDIAVQLSTQSLLESHRYAVLSTNDSMEAIALYSQHHADIKLVILDIMMPTMSGISVIQRLNAIDPEVRILAMSGLSANRESALIAGANAFISKPFTLDHLLESLQNLMTDLDEEPPQ